VQAIHADGLIRVVVRDHGQWRSPRNDGHGRGLQLIRGLVDDVQVVQTMTGTEVQLERRLGGAPPARGVEIPHPAMPPTASVDASVAVVQLSGDIDLANAGPLYHEIIDAIGHDAIGLVLDLSGVEHLDSAGLRLLYRLAARLAPRRQAIRVVAAADGPVRRILTLSGFDDYAPITSTTEAAVRAIRGAQTQMEIADPSA
jgi:anti-anti-sigma factor